MLVGAPPPDPATLLLLHNNRSRTPAIGVLPLLTCNLSSLVECQPSLCNPLPYA